MAYQTFSLKYRPRNFDEIVAQDHVSRTLRNAVAEGRVAHGYVFAGPRGTGKTSTARILAKALNCVNGPTPDPCGVCHMCEAIAASRSMDVIERDAASERGIDAMKALIEKVPFAPAEGKYKVYILDEAHMLTTEAANALLKTLEEPPDHCYFVLATTELHKIMPTIKSRCQVFEFRPIPLQLIMNSLAAIADKEGIEADEAALASIARAANGAMRDAQSIFDQVVAFSPGRITLEVANSVLGVTEIEILRRIAAAIADGDIEACFAAVDDVVGSGKDIAQLIEDLAQYTRDLLRLSMGAMPPAWSQVPEADREGMAEQAHKLGSKNLTRMIKRLGEAGEDLKGSSQHALLLEMVLSELASITAPEPVAAPTLAPVAAPEPEPAPAPTPEVAPEAALAPPVEMTLDAVQERWPQVAVALRELKHVSIVGMLKTARVAALQGDDLTLAFAAKDQYVRDRADGPYRAAITDAVEKAMGRRFNMLMRIDESAPPVATPAPVAQETPPDAPLPATAEQQDEAVRGVLDDFPGSREVTQ